MTFREKCRFNLCEYIQKVKDSHFMVMHNSKDEQKRNNPLPASESRFCLSRKKQLEALPENSREDLSWYYICRSCGIKFDSFGGMQRHILEDMQKGDIISDDE